ncbi:MAG: glycosyltransferase [Candidatus Eremiobacteraeota bacterium]|nr:glycosyltransferase [Candidatus Eremiobacteraeota bacterium]MBC5823189.1 glycosyltransferase [Candidatus Eremiobacteraeota bacterium]
MPNRATGYCTDDVARALVVAVAASDHQCCRERALELGSRYLAFLLDAQLPDGRFHNFMSYARGWLDECGTEDSIGRAVWALGYTQRFAPLAGWSLVARRLLSAALPNVTRLSFIRSRAYAALGLTQARAALGGADSPQIDAALRAIGDDLLARHAAHAAADWDWFEDEMTYDNARLPEALLRIGTVLDNRAFVALGLRTLAFYESVVMEDGMFVPVGNAGWYRRGGTRARFDQQPLEAASLVDAALAAEAATGDSRYRALADAGFQWFFGRNSGNAALVHGGGCCDGLEPSGPNRNMGAESTLAYLGAALALAPADAVALRIARKVATRSFSAELGPNV